MDATRLALRCPRCGRVLPADAAEGLCAACLLSAGTETLTQSTGEMPTMLSGARAAEALTVRSSSSPPDRESGDAHRLDAGRRFGPYQIHHLLGRGGMGEVYEAEHVDTGRRVALKVLRGRLHDAEDRARFLYEGQLAASVSHPHTVYIFGSEEIAGLPVITMELLPGGTLKDRVASGGPMSVPDAVAAVLDIIGGLDAAQAAGILHRDIKPSNCFTDADGTVKVGDFGLSISTLARDVRETAAPQGFQGTPQFAPPEQLRGEPLDVRADIYAVGATLYYLLTGHAPFDMPTTPEGGADLRALVARVTGEPPRSPRVLRPDVPAGLAAIVLRCLAKDPKARPASYAVLAEALRPFSRTDVQPARLGTRLVAGLVDAVIIGLPVAIMSTWRITPDVPSAGASARVDGWTWIIGVVYYLLLEGATGASLGKRLFGLRVRTAAGPASWRAVAARTAVFYLPAMPFTIPVMWYGQAAVSAYLASRPAIGIAATLSTIVLTLALFATARRRNGYAALHDLVTGTRVTRRSPSLARRSTSAELVAGVRPAGPAVRGLRCGPFEVTGDLGVTDTGRLLAGFDPVLRRRVWIHAVPNGTPPVVAARRDVGRTSRLHWLTGRRAPDENWDAYEAPPGELLAAIAREPSERAWPVAKGWLTDLALELEASERDGILPRLGLDRVWVRHDGHAVLLDFPLPSSMPAPRVAEELTPVALLGAVGRHALGKDAAAASAHERPSALPLSATALVERLTTSPALPVAAARIAIAAAAASSDAVARWRRAVPVALAAAPVIVLAAGALAAIPVFRSSVTPDRMEMLRLLGQLDGTQAPAASPLADDERRSIEVYLAGQHGALLVDQSFWSGPMTQGQVRRLAAPAARIAAIYGEVPPEELARARQAIAPRLAAIREEYSTSLTPGLDRAVVIIAASMVAVSLLAALVVSLASALVSPGGALFKILGLAVVSRSGREISRARSVLRVLVAWSPAVAWFISLGFAPIDRMRSAALSPLVPAALVLAALAAGAAWTLVRRTRGPHDVITRTWVVPR